MLFSDGLLDAIHFTASDFIFKNFAHFVYLQVGCGEISLLVLEPGLV